MGENINSIFIGLDESRPVFNTKYDRYRGLQILINDTEHTTIRKKNFNMAANGKWTGTFCFHVIDHFGLDKHDALAYQLRHPGFATWWLLQHRYANVPFITSIAIEFTITGNIQP